MKTVSKLAFLAGVALAPMILSAAAHAQEAGPARNDVVVITGTRVEDRSALDTVAAVDVVSSEALEKGGVTEVNQALSVALPSFNFPRPALTDGTDTIRPAALRGLAPDQTLVLLNNKRRHAASLVNVNGSIGRGSAAVDLNTIPSAGISAVEVLRDGASAQYGSDAIAGVINVRMREANSGGGVSASYGWRETEYTSFNNASPTTPAGFPVPTTLNSAATRDVSDGETAIFSAWKGFGIGASGFLTLSGEYKEQSHTERSGLDTRQQYVLVNGAYDPREATINRYNAWTGEPEMSQWTLFANAGYDASEDVSLYGWASYQNRDAVSAGFFRRANDDRNITSIYPNGFLPKINPEVTDFSIAGGSEFALGGWDMDASLVYGSNKMAFTIKDTLNRSIGPTSKTFFDAGGFQYDQLVANISGVREYDVGFATPLNVATGVEWRKENYEIFAGEPDSWRQGGVLLNGAPTPAGAQVFPGFRPTNEVDESRTAVGVYVDVETNVTDALLLSAAVRGEDYSDFGETLTGKFAARYDFTDSFALRGSVQNGFRAPSAQQQFFQATSTNFVNGVPFEVTTFPVSTPVARALGAQDLDAEKSINYSLGSVIRLGGLDITIDAYQINVDDRIVLSENLGTTTSAADVAVRNYLAAQNLGGNAGRFFINGVDTETQGIDIVANYSVPEMAAGKFDLTFGANFQDTKVTKIPTTNQLSALNPPPVLFGRVNVLTFEKGTPDSKIMGAADWRLGAFGATFRATRYGEVLAPGTTAAQDFTLEAKTLLDLEARWYATEMATLAIGADNITDEYPDGLPGALNTTNNVPFSSYSPYGFQGRFVYGKVSFNF
jgi:iron complex outermembrane receptor protein